jgi:hypothetical protein
MTTHNASQAVIDVFELSTQMGCDFQHPLWETFCQLPTSEMVSTLSSCIQYPQLLASAVFRLPEADALIGALNRLIPFELINYSDWKNATHACFDMWLFIIGKDKGKEHANLYIRERMRQVVEHVPSLTTVMGWIQYQLSGYLSEAVRSVALAKSQDIYQVNKKLWSGESALIQTKLLREYGSVQVWPASNLFSKAMLTFYDKAPQKIQSILEQSNSHITRELFWPFFNDYKCAVINIPVLCGLWSMSPVDMRWWLASKQRISLIKQLRCFAPVWFETAFNQGAKMALVFDVYHDAEV